MTRLGLPDASVRESRDRVQSAIRNSGFEFPRRHVTVNLSPADVRKVGSAFDLPIALGVLAATGLIPARPIDDAGVLGELSRDGAKPRRLVGMQHVPALGLEAVAPQLREARHAEDVARNTEVLLQHGGQLAAMQLAAMQLAAMLEF